MKRRSLELRRYQAGARAEWDGLVAHGSTRHFFFQRDYMEYHADRFEDLSLMVYDDQSTLLAVMPANAEDELVVSHGGLTFGGLIADESMTARKVLDAVTRIRAELGSLGYSRLIYKPAPHIYQRTPSDEALYALFRHDARLVRRDLGSVVRMGARIPCTKGRRSAIKRARREDLEMAEDRDFESFMLLEAKRLDEKYGVAPVHTGAEMSMLARRFPDNIRLFSCRHMGELLAGVLVYESEFVAHAQYIASSENGRRLGALDLIIDELIEQRYATKTFFDFGISTDRQGRYLNEGLLRNKESFGARALMFDCYELDL